jgi:Asp/Glu/Hydantoin racemase
MPPPRFGAYLAQRAKALELAGAQLLLCVSNTLHRTAPVFTAGLSVPFLHIVDPTAEAIRAKGLKRVALLGTKPVMSTDFLIRRYTESIPFSRIESVRYFQFYLKAGSWHGCQNSTTHDDSFALFPAVPVSEGKDPS